MRLAKLTLKNFRCYREPTSVDFDDMTVIVGRNDAGKSTILDALDIFFDGAKLDKDDGSVDGDGTLIEIACEFDDLPTHAIIDEDFSTTFSDEFLLNALGRLEIVKQYGGAPGAPKLTGIFARALHPRADNYSDLLQLKKGDLSARAKKLGVDLTGVKNKNANAPIRAAIRAAATDLNMGESLVPLDKEDAKQIWARISTYLPTYALFKSDRASTDQDPEAQDPLKAAIREAIKQKEDQLLRIQTHIEDEVRKIAAATVEKLREMDDTLASTLSPVVTAKKWDTLFQTSITGDFGIPINKRGSGVKRLILLNFFRAKAERAASEHASGAVVYAIEEPETSQHPHNQRMLMSALQTLAGGADCQVIVTTHTPMLARSFPDKSLRFVRPNAEGQREILLGGGETNSLIAKSLGVLPDNTVKLFVGVEGKHDIAFLKGMCRVLRSEGVSVPDLEKLELDGELIFFPFGGENLALWGARLKHLNRPEFHLCDRDCAPPSQPKYATHIQDVNGREGCFAISTLKREMENYIHPDAVIEAYRANGHDITLGSRFEDFDDVPAIVAEALHRASGATLAWNELDEVQRKKKVSKAKVQLNNAAISKMTSTRLKEIDSNGEIVGWFDKMSEMLAG